MTTFAILAVVFRIANYCFGYKNYCFGGVAIFCGICVSRQATVIAGYRFRLSTYLNTSNPHSIHYQRACRTKSARDVLHPVAKF